MISLIDFFYTEGKRQSFDLTIYYNPLINKICVWPDDNSINSISFNLVYGTVKLLGNMFVTKFTSVLYYDIFNTIWPTTIAVC